VEQNHDDGGIIWPMALAPYHITVLALQPKKEEVMAAAEKIYEELLAAGAEVVFDDRKSGAGHKFKDADLIGIPLRIAVGGRGLEEGIVEYKPRAADEAEKVPLSDIVARALADVASQL
jgi:prolyl-tRNA synthetase